MLVGIAADYGGFELKEEMGRTPRLGDDVVGISERLQEAALSGQEAIR